MRHIISCLVENRAGVLAHVAGLFSSRGFNIESLSVSTTENPATSRMTIVTSGDEAILEQIRKQLNKLIPVLKVADFSGQNHVERDLLLAKVASPPGKRTELMALLEVFQAKVVDITQNDMVVEVSGPGAKIDALLDLLSTYGLKEVARTGSVAMLRSRQ